MLHVFSQNRQSASAAEHLKGTDGCNTLINHTHTQWCVWFISCDIWKTQKKIWKSAVRFIHFETGVSLLESKLKAELVFIFRLNLHDLLVVFFFLPPTNLLSQNPIFLQIVQPTVTWEQSRWRTRRTGYVSLPAVACPHPGSVKEHKCTTFSVREHVVVLQWWVTLSWRLFLFAGPGVDGQRQNQPRL